MSWFKVGAALGGALLGGLLNKSSAKSQAQQNADLSRDNWIYQQSNAHQLEVQDLKNAGLNPILSATNSQMAGMSPVSGQSSGQGELLNNAISTMLEQQNKKEMQKADLEIEKQKLINDKLRIDLETKTTDAAIDKMSKEGIYLGSLTDLNNARVTNETKETDARVRHISAQIENENKLTDAQVDKLRSGIALDNATIDKLVADTKLSIERSNLTYWEKTQLITNLTDSSAQLKRMNAKQQLEYLSTGVGEVQNKAGFGIRLMSPIQGFGFGSNGYSTVRF